MSLTPEQEERLRELYRKNYLALILPDALTRLQQSLPGDRYRTAAANPLSRGQPWILNPAALVRAS
jgi:hypothetical protein